MKINAIASFSRTVHFTGPRVDVSLSYTCCTHRGLYVCVLGTRVSCAKTVELIAVPYSRILVWVGQKNLVLDRVIDPAQKVAVLWGGVSPGIKSG